LRNKIETSEGKKNNECPRRTGMKVAAASD